MADWRRFASRLCRGIIYLLVMVGALLGPPVHAASWQQLRIDQPTLADFAAMRASGVRWQAVAGEFPNPGIGMASWWFRYELAPRAGSDDAQVLWIRNGIYRELELYVVQDDALVQQQRGGTRATRSQFHDLFFLRADATRPLTLYLRVDSPGIVQLPAQVLGQSQLVSLKERDDFRFGLFLGVLLIMQAYFLVLYFIVRDKGMLHYVLHAAAATLLIVLWRGFDRASLWPPSLQLQLLLPAAQLVVACAIQLVLFFLRCRDATSWDVRLLVLLRNAALALVLLTPLLPMTASIAGVVVTTSAMMPLLVLTLIRYGHYRELTYRLFLFSWIVFVPATLGMMLYRLGLIALSPQEELFCYGGWVAEIVLQAFALAVRVDVDQREKLAAQTQLIAAREREAQAQSQALHHEQQARAAADEAAQAQLRYAHELELRVTSRRAELEQIRRELAEISITDALTGVRNRRFFAERLDEEMRRVRELNVSLSLLLVDVDHFKRINDNFGHIAGDECLQQVAVLLQAQLKRPCDVVCRYGGEEFAILLPQTPLPGALAFANTLRNAVCAQPLRCAGTPINVSISIGLVVLDQAQATSAEAVLDRADRALYQAKHDGRNCVRVAA